MGSSIWCNEPWAGLDATGPWGTDFDGYTTAEIAALRHACSSVPKRAEPRSLWALPTTSRVPVWSGVATCLDSIMTEFVQRGTTKGLDTSPCNGATAVPPFPLTG